LGAIYRKCDVIFKKKIFLSNCSVEEKSKKRDNGPDEFVPEILHLSGMKI